MVPESGSRRMGLIAVPDVSPSITAVAIGALNRDARIGGSDVSSVGSYGTRAALAKKTTGRANGNSDKGWRRSAAERVSARTRNRKETG